MTSAILEILLLLTVSCLIGVFFTYRFWKAKYNELQKQNSALSNEVKKLNADLASAKSRNTRLEDDLSKLQKELDKKKTPEKSKAPVEDKGVVDQLKSEIELLTEQMEEKEREIEALSKELDVRKVSYYRQIDGKRYKAVTINMADEAVAGQGDGRISKEDAEKVFATISDGRMYTQVEKDTMKYLRDNYKWTEGADALFRTKVRSWAAKNHELA